MTQTHILPYEDLAPSDIVRALDGYIVGQSKAKRAVANAYRFRVRRLRVGLDESAEAGVDHELREEISPKNILMIGPTGVGKTEIARRLARLISAPFVKVEATKFTEVGYVGKDVDSIVRDLLEDALAKVRSEMYRTVAQEARSLATHRVLLALRNSQPWDAEEEEAVHQAFEEGVYDEVEIEIETQGGGIDYEIFMPQGMEELSQQLQNLMQTVRSERTVARRMTVRKALAMLIEEESSKLMNEDDVRQRAIKLTEEQGIVFIDEIDKVVRSHQYHGDVSREGVQRDLLPLLDGTVVNTKYGNVRTDHILFIASGAFMNSRPNDMISELQGRLPIVVRLEALTQQDFKKILKETRNSLIKQYTALFRTEGVELVFEEDGLERVAELAALLNASEGNIGARRLQGLMEMLLEDLSFEYREHQGGIVAIDRAYVDRHASTLVERARDDRDWVL